MSCRVPSSSPSISFQQPSSYFISTNFVPANSSFHLTTTEASADLINDEHKLHYLQSQLNYPSTSTNLFYAPTIGVSASTTNGISTEIVSNSDFCRSSSVYGTFSTDQSNQLEGSHISFLPLVEIEDNSNGVCLLPSTFSTFTRLHKQNEENHPAKKVSQDDSASAFLANKNMNMQNDDNSQLFFPTSNIDFYNPPIHPQFREGVFDTLALTDCNKFSNERWDQIDPELKYPETLSAKLEVGTGPSNDEKYQLQRSCKKRSTLKRKKEGSNKDSAKSPSKLGTDGQAKRTKLEEMLPRDALTNKQEPIATPTRNASATDQLVIDHFSTSLMSESAPSHCLQVQSPNEPQSSNSSQFSTEIGPKKCAKCKNDIWDRMILTVGNEFFHCICLKCNDCEAILENSEKCYIRNCLIFCEECYLLKYGHICANINCGRKIKRNDWVRKARQFYYHLACFKCEKCNRQLSTSEQFGIDESEKQILCKQHFLGEDCDQKQKAKRIRTSFTDDQLERLQEEFKRDSNPDGADLERIALLTRLSKRVTQVWFQNSRARQKKHQILPKGSEQSEILTSERTASSSSISNCNSGPSSISMSVDSNGALQCMQLQNSGTSSPMEKQDLDE